MVQQTLVVTDIVLALALFVWGRWRFDMVAMAALLVLVVAGIIPVDHAFNGFANPAVITVAAVMAISRGMRNAGAVDALADALSGLGMRVWRPVLTGVTSLVSGFVSDTGTTGIMIPVALKLSRQGNLSPSSVLMPIAFASLLGGCITLIGTPSNILIAGFRAKQTGTPFGMFDFSPVGLVLALACLAFTWFIGWRLVPARLTAGASGELFRITDYLTEVSVPAESPYANKTVAELGSTLKEDFVILGIVRGGRRLSVTSSQMALQGGDVLIVKSDAETLKNLLDTTKFELAAEKALAERFLTSDEISLVEGVVGAGSRLIGRTAVQMNLRRYQGVNLLGVSRHGQRLGPRLAGIRLQSGDVLLLQGDKDNLPSVLERLGCFPLASRALRLGKPTRVFTSVLVFGAAIVLPALGVLSVPVAFSLAVVLMAALGILGPDEVYESIDWSVIILLGAFIPVGEAMHGTGFDQTIATAFLGFAGHQPVVVSLAAVLGGTLVLANIVNHTAAVVIMAPIGIAVAQGLGGTIDPFLMAVAVGGSLPMLTPLGHQANILVMGPGGYRFGDYWRLGLPLSLLVMGLAPFLIKVFWPF